VRHYPKQRKAIKDKKTGLPKRYLSGIKGAQRSALARVTQQISKLYQQGKRIPQSLIEEKIALGKRDKKRR
jgi:CRISPR/Cas system CMR subunit Cmr4 (Cas7 group RAMP superfamily)